MWTILIRQWRRKIKFIVQLYRTVTGVILFKITLIRTVQLASISHNTEFVVSLCAFFLCFASNKWWYTQSIHRLEATWNLLRAEKHSNVLSLSLNFKGKQIVFAVNCLRCFDFIAFNVWQEMFFYGMKLHTSTPLPSPSSPSFSFCLPKPVC